MADLENTGDSGLDPEEGQTGRADGDGSDGADGSPESSESWTPAQQAAFTKKTQALAEEHRARQESLTRDFETRQQNWQKESQTQVQQQAAQLARQYLQQYQAQSGQQDPLASIKSLEMVDGPTLYQMVQHLDQQRFAPIARYAQQLATQNQYLYQELGKISKLVESSEGQKRQADFDSLLKRTLDDLGLPDEEWSKEALKDLYLSHQNDGKLHTEFPTLAKQRIESLQKAFRSMDRQRAQTARQKPFATKAGAGASPSGKAGDKERYDPKSLADMLFEPETDEEE